MKQTIEKYISENNIITLCLSSRKHDEIFTTRIFLYYLDLENEDIIQKIVLSDKYISVRFYYSLDSYKNISILPYVNKISIKSISSANIFDVLHQSINLQRLTIRSANIREIGIKNKLYEKEFLKYIKIVQSTDVNLDDIYTILEIKSLDTLHFLEYFYSNYLKSENILKILSYIVNTLNKNIKIILDFWRIDAIFIKIISLITYNFKIDNHTYIFTYITKAFRKFDNLYDFNLYYQ